MNALYTAAGRWLYNSYLRGLVMLYSVIPSGLVWYKNDIWSGVNNGLDPFDSIREAPNWGRIIEMLWWEFSVREPDNSMDDFYSMLERYNRVMGLM